MGCAFCATGAAGLTRSLSASEIYDQVLHIRNDFEMRVSSVVFMGQGEPFMNYGNALEALRLPIPLTVLVLAHVILQFLPAVLFQ